MRRRISAGSDTLTKGQTSKERGTCVIWNFAWDGYSDFSFSGLWRRKLSAGSDRYLDKNKKEEEDTVWISMYNYLRFCFRMGWDRIGYGIF